MTAFFTATTEEMARAAGRVQQVDEAVQAELSGLRARLEPLAGAWAGQAAARFAELMARWDTDARSLDDALRAIGEAIRSSGTTYQLQEDQQAAGMSSISSALG